MDEQRPSTVADVEVLVDEHDGPWWDDPSCERRFQGNLETIRRLLTDLSLDTPDLTHGDTSDRNSDAFIAFINRSNCLRRVDTYVADLQLCHQRPLHNFHGPGAFYIRGGLTGEFGRDSRQVAFEIDRLSSEYLDACQQNPADYELIDRIRGILGGLLGACLETGCRFCDDDDFLGCSDHHDDEESW